jgi:quercetin dioxygenase-like cupin family protein
MTQRPRSWVSGWTAETPLDVDYVFVAGDEGSWEPGPHAGLEQRDLGSATATNGLVSAHEVRVEPDGEPVICDWSAHEGDFLAIYVTEGEMTVEVEDGRRQRLGARDAVYVPALVRYRQEFSPGIRCLKVVAPAEADVPSDANTHQVAPANGSATAEPIFLLDDEAEYNVGAGTRKFFRYRDLGLTDVTERRMRLKHLSVGGEPEPTGWHHHTMGQIAIILSGRAYIEVENHGRRELTAGTGLHIGGGMRHNLDGLTSDYTLLEVYMPADYDTTPCDPPAMAARAEAR